MPNFVCLLATLLHLLCCFGLETKRLRHCMTSLTGAPAAVSIVDSRLPIGPWVTTPLVCGRARNIGLRHTDMAFVTLTVTPQRAKKFWYPNFRRGFLFWPTFELHNYSVRKSLDWQVFGGMNDRIDIVSKHRCKNVFKRILLLTR